MIDPDAEAATAANDQTAIHPAKQRVADLLHGAGQQRMAQFSRVQTAMRCTEAEDWMVGRRLDRETLAGVGRRIRDAASPIDDIRATAAYRLRLAANLPLRLNATLPPLTP